MIVRIALQVLFLAGVAAAAAPLPEGPVELLFEGDANYGFFEGPLYDPAGAIYFTSILSGGSLLQSDIVRHDLTTGETEKVVHNSFGANGQFFDPAGGHVTADGGFGYQRIARRSASDLKVIDQVLVSQHNDLAFNSPNDLVFSSVGGLYFTDPDYFGRNLQPEGAYYLSPAGELTRFRSGLRRPNGVILSPDQQTLYVAYEQEFLIMAYDLDASGVPVNERAFASTNVTPSGVPFDANSGPDGLTVDQWGNVYAAVQGGVYAWSPAGDFLFDIPLSTRPTNVTLGGPDGLSLFITGGKQLLQVRLSVPEPQAAAGFAAGLLIALPGRPRRR